MAGRTLPINISTDVLEDTQKVTAGYFSGGGGELLAKDIWTGSLNIANHPYYFDIANKGQTTSSAEPQFSVAFGHYAGSGSNTKGNTQMGATELIYKQWANILLGPTQITGGFQISGGETSKPSNAVNSVGAMDEYVYILIGERARYKDRINPGNWSIVLSGSESGLGTTLAQTGSGPLHLTDDSKTTSPVSTIVGNRYNIVSGSNGSVHTGSTWKTFGWFYPEVGAMIFSGVELSASIPGQTQGTNMTASFAKNNAIGYANPSYSASLGFGPNLNAGGADCDEATNCGNPRNALRFVNCLQPTGAKLKFRSEEDQNSVSYFCRITSNEMNFSNNPTFTSGSLNEIRHVDMWSNPTVYITGLNLYSGDGELVANAKLSTPLKKNYGSEATIKVKLTY